MSTPQEHKATVEAASLKLTRELRDLFSESRVQDEIVVWAANHGILTIAAFADLASDRREVATSICTPAGIDIGESTLVQPARTAWRQADAISEVDDRQPALGLQGSDDASVDVVKLDHSDYP